MIFLRPKVVKNQSQYQIEILVNNPKLLINIDRLIYPLYFIVRALTPLVKPEKYVVPNDGKVVIIKMLGIGSITRIVSTLKQHNVDLNKVYFFTFSINRELCSILEIPNVFYIDSTSFLKAFVDVIRANSYIRKINPNYVIDYERSSNSIGVFTNLVTSFSRIGTISFYKSTHDQKSNLDVRYTIVNRSIYDLLMLSMPYLPKAKNKLSYGTIVDGNVTCGKILININASDYLPYRKYPLKGFAEIITGLLKQNPDCTIHLIGSRAEKEYVQSLISEYFPIAENVINCCGIWSLNRLMEEFDKTQLLITNDSGPMHLAVMRKVKTITIWGPTVPSSFGYINHPHVINLQSNRTCSPCFTYPKSRAAIACNGSISCMKDINPSQVVDAAMKLLAKDLVVI